MICLCELKEIMEAIVKHLMSSQFNLVVVLPVAIVLTAVILVFNYAFKRPTVASSKSSKKITAGSTTEKVTKRKENKKLPTVSASPVKTAKKAEVKKTEVKKPEVKKTEVKKAETKKSDNKKSSPVKEVVVAAPKKPVVVAAVPVVAAPVKKTKATVVAAAPVKTADKPLTRQAKNKKTTDKPADFDEGWMTVPTRNDKKKAKTSTTVAPITVAVSTNESPVAPSSPAARASPVAQRPQAKVTPPTVVPVTLTPEELKAKTEAQIALEKLVAEVQAKFDRDNVERSALTATIAASDSTNAKQVKDQVNKTRKEEVVVKYGSLAADEERNTAEIIQKISEAIVDDTGDDVPAFVHVDVKPSPSPSPPVIIEKAELLEALAAEKIDEIKPVAESNVAFDELGDAWTEAKAPKKGKKKARKD